MLLEGDKDAKSRIRKKFRECVRKLIRTGIPKGLEEIRKRGYTGCIIKPEYWQERLHSQHFGPDLGVKLFKKWQRIETNLSFTAWHTTEEALREQAGLLELFRARPEIRSVETEIHPESGLRVHKVDIDKVCVRQLNKEQRQAYLVQFETMGDNRVRLVRNGAPLVGKFAYVIGPDCQVYAATHRLNYFHHSSFLSGSAVIGAGKFSKDSEGFLRRIDNNSGHYGPGRKQFDETLQVFKNDKKIDLSSVEIVYTNV